MVNFKFYCLPLLVGLIEKAYSADCTFTLNNNSCTASEDCGKTDVGYYLINENNQISKSADDVGTIIKYQYDEEEKSGTCVLKSERGFYSLNGVTGYVLCDYESGNNNLKCILKSSTSADSCNSENSGKILGNSFCLGGFGNNKVYDYSLLPLTDSGRTEAVNYLVEHSKGNLFSFDKSANYYVVSVDDSSIVFNSSFSGVDITSDKDGKITTRKENFCSTNKAGKYYSCENGICTSRNKDSREIDSNGEEYCKILYNDNKFTVSTTPTDCRQPDIGYQYITIINNQLERAVINGNSYEFGNQSQTGNVRRDSYQNEYYVRITKNSEGKAEINIVEPTTSTVGVYYFMNQDPLTMSKFILVEYKVTLNQSNQQIKSYKLISDVPDENNYLVDSEDNSLMVVEKSGNDASITLVTKEKVADGYYFNTGENSSVVACDSTKGCSVIKDNDNKYITKQCTSAFIGAIKIDNDDFLFCKEYNSEKDLPNELKNSNVEHNGKYFINSSIFPGSNGKVIYIEKKQNRIVKVNSSEDCVRDGDIILKDESYYYCAGVVTTVSVTKTSKKDSEGNVIENEYDEEIESSVVDRKIEVPIIDDGAVFSIKINGIYYVVNISATEVEYSFSEGYYLDRSGRTIEVVTTNGDNNNKVTNGSDTFEDTKVVKCDGISCRVVSIDDRDIYANYEKKYNSETGNVISCNVKEITVNNVTEKPVKCSLNTVTEGYYTNINKGLVFCNNNGCTNLKDKTGYYINGNRSDSKDQLIYCYGSVCNLSEILTDNKYNYINADERKIPSIITCSNGSCSILENVEPYSYYIPSENEIETFIIKCQPYNNNVICDNDGSSEGSYIYARDTSKVIVCNDGNCYLKSGSNYYVDGNENNFGLIKCSGNSCTKVNGIRRGVYISGEGNDILVYNELNEKFEVINIQLNTCDEDNYINKIKYYLNGGSDKVTKPLIKGIVECKDKKEFISYTTVSASINTLYNNENNSDKNNFIFCTTSSSCREITTVNGKYLNVNDNKLFNCDNGNCVEDNNLKDTELSKKAYLVDASNMRVLDDNNVLDSKLVLCTTSKNSKDEFEVSCNYVTSNPSLYYINGNKSNSLIQTGGTNSFTILSNVEKGYYINSNTDVIQCNGSDKCKSYETKTCEANTIGSVNNQNLCISSTSPKTGKEGKYIISSSGFTDFGMSGTILVNYSGKTIVQDNSNEVKYYLYSETNKNIITNTSVGEVYKCISGSCTKVTISDTEIFINADERTASGSIKYPIIKCEKNNDKVECKLNTNNDGDYCLYGNSLYTCSNNCKLDSDGKLNSNYCFEISNKKEGLYLPYDNSKLIYCNSMSCKNLDEIFEGYYISADISRQLIKCETSLAEKRCFSVTANDGYYMGFNNSNIKKLIYCLNKECNEVNDYEGYYVAGESNVALLNCNEGDCEPITKPAEGWYKNSGGSISGKLLIYCNGNTCEEKKITGNGYLLYANSQNQLWKIIDQNVQQELIEGEEGYYVNADTTHIIECKKIDEKITCANVNVNAKSWYKFDNSKLIGCKKITSNKFGCQEYSNDDLIKGYYYLNSGDGKRLIEVSSDIGISLVEPVANSWYINGDNSAEDNEKIIACSTEKSCTFKDIKKVACTSKITGEFTNYYGGEISWCNDKNINMYENLKGSNGQIILMDYKNGLIPGLSITENANKAVIPMKVNTNSVEKIEIEGYYYYYNKLYLCKSNSCDEQDVMDGYYRNNKNIVFKCSDGKCDIVDNADEMYDFIRDDILNKIDIKTVYAITSGKEFPGSKKRYSLTEVTKYSIKFIDDIDEILRCPDRASDTDNSYCLKNDNKFYLRNDIVNSQVNIDATLNANGVEIEIKDDFDTNNGCYKYSSNNEGVSKLNEVIINMKEKKIFGTKEKYGEVKYECKINGPCVLKQLPVNKSLGFNAKNGILSEITKGNEGEQTNVVEDSIPDGKYRIKGDKTKIIDCENNVCSESNNMEKLVVGDDKLTYNGVESGIRSKYMLNESQSARKRDSDSVIKINTIYELTNVSFSSIKGSRNIFLNQNKELVSNDEDDIDEGYECHGDECKKITCNSEKYYINTVQLGESKNAVVKCYNDGNGSVKFEKINCSEENGNRIFENAAARDSNEAIITCNTLSCKTESASTLNGLPSCKYDGICIRADNSIELIEGQHCIYENKIYYKESNECKKLYNDEVYLFDSTLRELDPKFLSEDHYSALMYNCKNSKCYRTYGYILSNNGYSKCNNGKCEYIYENIDNDCKVVGPGGIIKSSDNTINICLNDGKYESIEKDGTYPISILNDFAFPEIYGGNQILVTIKDKIATVINDDKYILFNNNKILNTENVEGVLYQCYSNRKCNKVELPEYGYYSSNYLGDNLVIECGSKCEITSKYISFIKGMYEYYEEFPGYDNSVLTVSNGLKVTVFNANNYILLSNKKLAGLNEKLSLKELYKCNSDVIKCVKVESIYDGWYVSGDENIKAIKCYGNECEMKNDLKGSCTSEGDLIFKNGNYIICVNNPSLSEVKLLENVGKSYQLGTKGDHSFPNGKDYIVVNENSVIGIGTIKRKVDGINKSGSLFMALPQCSQTSTTKYCYSTKDSYCIKDNKIYYSYDENSSNKCKEVFKNEKVAVVFNGSQLVDGDKEIPSVGSQMFYCNGSKCTLTTGYYYIKEKMYKCVYHGCYLDAQNGNKLGQIRSKKLINDNTNIGGFNESVDENNVKMQSYYYINGSNEFPGADNYKSFLVEAGSNYFVLFNGNGYYLMDSNGSMMVKDTYESEMTSSRKRSTDGNENVDIAKRDSSYTMYYCDKTGCIKPEVVNGYYINAGVNAYNLAIIACSKSSSISGCELATENDIGFAVSNCENKLAGAGKIIRSQSGTNYQNYKFCTSKAQSSAIEIKSNAQTKYSIMNLKKGDKFLGIELSGESEVDVNVIVKTSNQGVEQFMKKGYILLSSTDVIVNVGNNQKYPLYKCEEKSLYDDNSSTETTVQCKQITNSGNGFYFNKDMFNDKRYIRCQDNLCSIAEALESDNCIESGSIIYNNNSHKLCVSKEKQIDIYNSSKYQLITNVSSINEFPGVKTNGVNISVEIESDKVSYVKINSFVVVDKQTNILGISGKLYKCENGICNYQELPNDGWYVKSDENELPVELIYCVNTECKVHSYSDDESDDNVKEGFYASASISKPIIQCVMPGKMVEGQFEKTDDSKPLCYERTYKEGWYLNANGSNSKPLIKCSKEEGCNEEQAISNGWYINNAVNSIYINSTLNDAPVYPIIVCNSEISCEFYDTKIEEKCSKGGEIIESSKGVYKLCKDENESIEFSSASTTKQQILKINSGGDFPNASSGYIIVEVSKTEARSMIKSDGVIRYYYKDGDMYKCTESCEKEFSEGIIVYDELTRNLMSSTNCKDESCTWTIYNKQGYVFATDENKLVTSVEDIPTKLYRCKKNSSNKLICYDMKKDDSKYQEGYYYNNEIKQGQLSIQKLYKYSDNEFKIYDDLPSCTPVSYKQNLCYISYDDECYVNDEKCKQTKDDKLGYVIESGNLCINENNSKIYLVLKKLTTGISDEENCVQVQIDDSVKYYEADDGIYSVDKYAIYKISNNEKNLINSLSNVSFSKNKEYSGILIQDDNIIDQNTIICADEKCNSSKTITCQYDFQTGICKTTNGSVNAGRTCQSVYDPSKIYLAITNLNTSGGKCVRYEDDSVRKSFESKNTKKIVDDYYVVIDKKMYSINNVGEVAINGEGIYILDNANYRVDIIDYEKEIDIGNTSIFKVYICNSDGCSIKTKCENGDLNEYMIDEITLTMYQCNPENNTLKKVEKTEKIVGYYLNSPTNDLIQCYSDSNYEVQCIRKTVKNGMEGYYVDKGNSSAGMMIKCKRENGKFTCIEEKMVECKYNDKEGTCESSVDLMRNSYCYFNYEDKVSGWMRKLVYIENYIKVGDKKKCVADDGNEYFFKYDNSKFLGHNERSDLIKFSRNSVVSIYEEDIGYYIISTSSGMGLLESDDLSLNKSRMYKCIQQDCIEIEKPIDGVVYINKASKERMIKYNMLYNRWEIVNNRCDVKYSNTKQCTVSKNVNIGDIIYVVDDQSIKFYYSNIESISNNENSKLSTLNNPNTEGNYEILEKNKYQIFDGHLYVYNENEQSFDIVVESGYYIFKNNDNKYNMEEFSGTGKIKYNNLNNEMKVFIVDDNKEIKSYVLEDREGYYLNKADINKNGSYLQLMRLSDKVKLEEENKNSKKRSVEDNHKYKFINNKCTVTRKNICVNVQDGQVIPKGSACVVVEGENKGIYLATANISKSSTTINCMKYDTDNIEYGGVTGNYVYNYINTDPTEFAEVSRTSILITVKENEIVPFLSNIESSDETIYDEGYYIIDNNDKKTLNSTSAKEATGYLCGINDVTKLYECKPESNPSKYYYSRNAGIVYANNKKWYQEEIKSKYFFYNKDYRGATIQKTGEGEDIVEEADTVIGKSSNVVRNGKYINSMVNDRVIIVTYDSSSEQSSIDNEILYCNVNDDGNCASTGTEPLATATKCYDKNKRKLYLVEVKEAENENEESKTLCHTGSEDNVKYYLIGSNLFYMDGNSIQEVDNGYYVLNDSWEEYSSNYPEVPQKIIKCDNYNCEVPSEGIKLNTEVLKSNSGMYKMFTDGKFVNAYKPGFYFFNRDMEVTISEEVPKFEHKYIILEDGSIGYGIYGKVNNYYTVVNENKVAIDYNYNNVYINYAKNGEFIKGDINYVNSLLTYDSDKDRIVYNGDFNEEDDKNVFKFIEVDNKNSLFKLKKKVLEHAESGLYAIQDGLPFKNKEWTSLKENENEICYYDSVAGQCSKNELNVYKKQKFMINKANEKLSIIEYDSLNNEWRVVTEDGYYFFFENEYSITESDRRVSKVLQILNGVIIDVTESEKMKGYFVFEGLMVEGTGNGWEDAVPLIGSVTVSGKKKCTSYEIDVSVKSNGFCYNEKMGICGIKNIITNDSKFENNCMFINENNMYYYIIDGNLYVLNKNMYQKINKSGIYVIGNSDTIFNSKIESDAIPYVCKESHCETRRNLASQYYLNMANVNENAPIILEYNNSNKSWKKTNKDGYYFFNVEGYPVTENEEIGYAYLVSENGNKIVNIRSNAEDGSYVSQSSQDDIIVVKNKNWNKASRVAKCSYDVKSKKIISSVNMKSGDICLMENKKLVLIKSSKSNDKREEEIINEEEKLYEGILSKEDSVVYSYIENDKNIIKIENNTSSIVDVTGYVIIDKYEMLPLSSTKPVDADAFQCNNGECLILTVDKLISDKLYVNEISKESSLVKYINNGQWNVVQDRGYYFLNNKGDAVDNNDVINRAFMVNESQQDITESMNVGYYLNKAKNNNIIISNNGNYWIKGEIMKKCNVTVTTEGVICSTTEENVKFNVGEYCSPLKGNELYLLTGEATYKGESPNCKSGSNENPLYITSDSINNKLINTTISDRLIELSSDSIKVALPGLYILNNNGNIVTDNEGEEKISIYRCSETICKQENSNIDGRILAKSGGVYEMDESGKLIEVNDEGIYFFNEEGISCSSDDDSVANIVRITNIDNKPVIENIGISELKNGAYVNEAESKTAATYEGNEWTVKVNNCVYKAEEETCTNDNIELDVGSHCIVDGKFYVIYNITESNMKKCIPGSNSEPIYLMNKENQLMIIKEKSINYISNEGYYAINEQNEALVSEELVKSKFMQCEYGGECNEIKPDIGSYINRAVDELNIVNYPTGEIEKANTSNTYCNVNEEYGTCNVSTGELNSGDVCIAFNSIYLISDNGKCVKAEKSVISYQLVNKKLYMLKDDSVIQKMDGYYFVNAEKRAISNKDDYAKAGTVGYMCSNKGDCFVMESKTIKYYPDYTTRAGKKFNIIKYDPSKKLKKSRRQEEEGNGESEGSSGYENVEEEGIYKLDDGSYAECEMNDNEEISCHEIDSEGTKKTNDGEIIVCTEDEEGDIECTQATEGGYYIIDGELMECEPSEYNDKLECEEMDKEGYFLATPEEILYECIEKEEETTSIEEPTEDTNISKVYDNLNANGENSNLEDPEDSCDEDGCESSSSSIDSTTTTTTTTETSTTTSTTTEETTSTTTTSEEPTPTPLDVVCKPVECEVGKIISQPGEDGEIEMYICKTVDDKNKYVASECDSGSYVKDGDYYTCEDEKDDVDENKIEKPNKEHTSTTDTQTTTTEEETSTETTTNESSESSTIVSSTESSTDSSTTSITTTTTTTTTTISTKTTTTTTTTSSSQSTSKTDSSTTTTKKTSTTKTATATTTSSGASSLIRKLPSFTIYLVILFISYYLLI